MGTEAVRFLVLWMAGWVNSRQLEVIDFLREENRVLREQLGRRRLRFTEDQRRRLAVKGRIVGRRRLGEFAGLVTPDTILGWYRELVARKYDGSARRRTGRPTVAIDVEQLVVRMARENPTWGYTRLVGALDNLGHQLGRNTVKRVLRRHGLEPAPARGKRMPWKTFLRTHLGAIAAADFFSVEVLTVTGLVRYFVLFVMWWRMPWYFLAGLTLAVAAPPSATSRALRLVTLFLGLLAMFLYGLLAPDGSS